jgi:xylan 1,4-beta-xylosidase
MSGDTEMQAGLTAAQPGDSDARADWERRIGQRGGRSSAVPGIRLPAPSHLSAEPGAGHIRLAWAPVPGAAGYLIERAGPGPAADSSAPEILRHGGSDVPAVVGPPFADTGIADGATYRYRVAAVAGAELARGAWSGEARSHTTAGTPGPVEISVDTTRVVSQLDRVWQMVGAERLSQLPVADTSRASAAASIGTEFAAALRLAHTDLGATMVRVRPGASGGG